MIVPIASVGIFTSFPAASQVIAVECEELGRGLMRVPTYELLTCKIVDFMKFYGAGSRSRTRDLKITNHALYQLSYTGTL